MFNWFECKVKYEKQAEDGAIKSTSETYLVDAQTFTEAEARIVLETKAFASVAVGELSVENIKRIKIAEMFNMHDESADRWYRSKVNFITIDEKKGVEKRTSCAMMVKGKDIQEALKELEKGLSTGASDYEIVNISETPIMDVFEYAPITTSKAKEGNAESPAE
ncbi:MAG: DUF4494 domain-containing protein [Paludibacteraceae bacterium]|nr:DUF4494 domain-containing protein [Paludibacteraceae bacterium]